jgi:hypothetical protein
MSVSMMGYDAATSISVRKNPILANKMLVSVNHKPLDLLQSLAVLKTRSL